MEPSPSTHQLLTTTSLQHNMNIHLAQKEQAERLRAIQKLSEGATPRAPPPFQLTEGEILQRAEESSGERCTAESLSEARLINMNIAGIQGLDRMGNLRSLDLSCNIISKITGVGALRGLKELRLAANNLTTVSGVGRLPALEVLYLQHNQLRMQGGEGAELAKCKRLQTLSLSSNRLGSVTELGGLGSLTVLDVSHNKIASLAGLTEKLSKLMSLDVRANQLTTIDPCVRVLKSLEDFTADDNRISEATVLSTLPKLTAVRLDGNMLTAVVPPCFKKLRRVKELFVARNQIDARGLNDLHKVAPQLETFDASENRIDDDPTCPIPATVTVGDDGEETRTLQCKGVAKTLSLLPLLSELSLKGNPVAAKQAYRLWVLEAVPELQVLDERPVTEMGYFDAGRPGSPQSRPGSAMGNRPNTPGPRPGTPGTRPGSSAGSTAGDLGTIPLVRPGTSSGGSKRKEVMHFQEAEKSAQDLLAQLDAFKANLTVDFRKIKDKCEEKYGPPEVKLASVIPEQRTSKAGKRRLVIDASGPSSRPGSSLGVSGVASSSGPHQTEVVQKEKVRDSFAALLEPEPKPMARIDRERIERESNARSRKQERKSPLAPTPPSRPSPGDKPRGRGGRTPEPSGPSTPKEISLPSPVRPPPIKSSLLDFALEGEDAAETEANKASLRKEKKSPSSPAEVLQHKDEDKERDGLEAEMMAGIEADMAEVSRAHAEVVSRLQLDQVDAQVSDPNPSRSSPVPAAAKLLTPRTAALRGAPTERERKGGLTWKRPDSRQGSEAGSRPGSARDTAAAGGNAGATGRSVSSLGFNLQRSSSQGPGPNDSGDQAVSEIKKALAASNKSNTETMASLFTLPQRGNAAGARPTTAEAEQRAKAKARRGILKR